MSHDEKIIAVDFDGTVVTHDYPRIGKSVGAESTLRKLVKCGHKLILFTMRSGCELTEAVTWFNERKIKLWAVNDNPRQFTWTNSKKVYAHIYIDDAALGCPLIRGKHKRPFVDWKAVRRLLFPVKHINPKGRSYVSSRTRSLKSECRQKRVGKPRPSRRPVQRGKTVQKARRNAISKGQNRTVSNKKRAAR